MVIDCPRAAHVRAAPESPGAGRRTTRRRTGARVGRGPFEKIGAPPCDDVTSAARRPGTRTPHGRAQPADSLLPLLNFITII